MLKYAGLGLSDFAGEESEREVKRRSKPQAVKGGNEHVVYGSQTMAGVANDSLALCGVHIHRAR